MTHSRLRRALAMSAALLVLAARGPLAGEEPALSASLLGGSAANVTLPLEITQEGSDGFEVQARFETRAFEPPLYYVLRLGRETARGAWEMQLVHHKLHLTDPPPEIQHFEVSHGYNLVTLGHAWRRGSLTWRALGGAVIPHTESSIRGRPRDAGYTLGGPVLGGGFGGRRDRGRLFGLAELTAFVGWTTLPVAGGEARGFQASLHLTIGAGVTSR